MNVKQVTVYQNKYAFFQSFTYEAVSLLQGIVHGILLNLLFLVCALREKKHLMLM